MPTLKNAIEAVERSHFRTVHDTGANSCALMVHNAYRTAAGLPRLTLADLHAYCAKCGRYHAQPDCYGAFYQR